MSYRKFTKDIGIIGITNFLIALSRVILIPILTKSLGAGNYGIWVQIIVTISILTPLTTIGLPFTLVRFLAAEKSKKEIQDGIYSTSALVLALSLILSALLILLSKQISNFLGDGRQLVEVLALIVPVQSLSLIFLNVFRAFQQMKKYSFFTLLRTYGELALIAYTVTTGYGLLGAVFSVLFVRSIVLIVMGVFILKRVGPKLPGFCRIKEYLAFGLPTIPGSISSWLVNSSDRYVIGFFWGATFVGYYSPGYTLGSIIGIFLAPLGFVLPAVLSKFYDENNITDVKTYLRYSLKYFLALAIPSVFGLSILSRQLLTILSTPEIASRGYLTTPFVATSFLLYGIISIVSNIIALVKKTRIVGIIWVIAALSNLGLNILAVPRIGILGAAITTLIAFTIAFSLTAVYSFKYIKFKIDIRFIFKSIFASVIATFIIIALSPIRTREIVFTIITAALSYATILFVLRGFTMEEIRFFKKLFKI